MADQHDMPPPLRAPAPAPAALAAMASIPTAPTTAAPPPEAQVVKLARSKHVLANAKIAGDDGKLARVTGNAIAMAPVDVQSKIADILIAGSKKQYRRELFDAFTKSEVPVGRTTTESVPRV